MAFVHGRSCTVLVNEDDLSQYFNDLSWSKSADTAETSTFGDSDKTYIVGMRDGTISLSGLWDGSAGAVDKELNEALGSDGQTVSIAPAGATSTSDIGGRVLITDSIQSSYEVSGSVGDVVSVSAEFQGDDGVFSGYILDAANAVSSTSTSSSSVDQSASYSDEVIATLHVTANTRDAGTLDIDIEDSTNDSTWATLASFTQVAAGSSTSETITVSSGTVDRYLRASYTVTGGTSGSYTCYVNLARKYA